MPKCFVVKGYTKPDWGDTYLIVDIAILDTIRKAIEEVFPYGAAYVSYHPNIRIKELPMDMGFYGDTRIITVELSDDELYKLPWYEGTELNIFSSNDFFFCAEDEYSSIDTETFSIDELILALDHAVELKLELPPKCETCKDDNLCLCDIKEY